MASVSLLEPLVPREGLTASDKDAGSPYCRRSNVSGHVASLDASLLDGRKVGTPGPRAVIPKVLSADWQQEHHLGTCQKGTWSQTY